MGTIVTESSPLHATLYGNVDLDSGVTVVKGSGATVYAIEVDNSDNIVPVFLSLWNNASAAADSEEVIIARISKSAKRLVILNGSDGFAFGTGIVAKCSTTSGGTTAPTNDVPCKFWTN